MDVSRGDARMPVAPGPREDLVAWAVTSRETGEVVVWQAPNVPAALSLVAGVATLMAPRESRLRAAAGAATALVSAWWGADELARGVNPLRRALGAGALLGVAVVGAAVARRAG